jgi:hypothetical protein
MDIKKIIAKCPTGYVEECAAKTEEDLRADIIEAEARIREVVSEREKDEKLNGAKELVKDLSSGYNDAVKAQRAKIAYALHVLDDAGKL